MKSVIYCIISSFIAFYLFCIYIFDNSLIFTLLPVINTFKFHVSCTDGKISVRINLLFYLRNIQMWNGTTGENDGRTIN